MALLMRVARLSKLNVCQRFATKSLWRLQALNTNPALIANVGKSVPPWAVSSRCFSCTSYKWNDTAIQKGEEAMQNDLQDHLLVLDNQVKRTGRLDCYQVYAALRKAEKQGIVTEAQSLMLLRSTGAVLVREPAAKRMQVFSEVWDRLVKLGATFDITHYNAALRVRLENKDHFDPAQALSDIESLDKIFPNRVTYQLLVAAFCERGDIDGASKILEFMKAKEMTITTAVFNYMIKGHIRKGDIEGSKAVLQAMRDAGIHPEAETMGTMLIAHAERGDKAAVDEVLQMAEAEEMMLQSRHLFDTAVVAIKAGHTDIKTLMFDLLTRNYATRPPYNHDAQNCAYELVTLGHDKEALETLACIISVPDDSYMNLTYTRLLKAMVTNHRDVKELVKLVERLKEMGRLDESLDTVALWAIQGTDPAYALSVFREMKKKGAKIERHYFWPLFKNHIEQRDTEGLYNTVRDMQEMCGIEQRALFDIYFHALNPLEKMGVPMETVLDKLKDVGVAEDSLASLKAIWMTREGRYEDAINTDAYIGLLALKSLLPQSYAKTLDAEGVVNMLDRYAKRHLPRGNLGSDMATVLQRVVDAKAVSPEDKLRLVNAWADKGFPLNPTAKESLLKSSLPTESTERAMEKSERESSEDVDRRQNDVHEALQSMRSLSDEKLAQVLEDNPRHRLLKNRAEIELLRRYSHQGNLERAQEVKQSMDQRGFMYNRSVIQSLAVLEARHKGNVEQALQFKELLDEEGYVSRQVQLALAHVYITQSQVDKAKSSLEEIKKLSEDPTTKAATEGEGEGAEGLPAKKAWTARYELCDKCEDVLQACVEHHPAEVTRDVLDLLFDLGYVHKGTVSLLDIVNSAYLKEDNPDGLVSLQEHFVTRYGKAASFNQVFRYFINREDADRLQKVVDLVSTVKGELDVLQYLVFDFIECGKPKQARKLLQTPGLRANMKLINSCCKRLFMESLVSKLEEAVDVTKDLMNIDRDEMLFWLIRSYTKEKAFKKALDVLSRYEEEGVLPRDRTLRYLAKVLEGADMEVPFEVPPVTPKQEQKKESPKSVTPQSTTRGVVEPACAEERQILDLVNEGKYDEAVQVKVNAPKAVRGDFFAKVAGMLSAKRQNDGVAAIVMALEGAGEVDQLHHLKTASISPGIKNRAHRALFKAYITSGRTKEILDFLAENPSQLSRYSSTHGVELMAEKTPEMLDRFLETVKVFSAEKETSVPASHVFSYRVIKGQLEEAKQLLQTYPKLEARMPVLYILGDADQRGNEAAYDVLLELSKGTPRQSLILGRKLLLKIRSNDVQAAKDVWSQIEAENIAVPSLGFKAVTEFGNLLEANGQAAPWAPEVYQQMVTKAKASEAAAAASSSSSSSSDSDSDASKAKSNNTSR